MSLLDPRTLPPDARAPLLLASASPRRRDLLAALGLERWTAVRPADVDEAPRPGERPEALALRLAEAKARAVAEALGSPVTTVDDEDDEVDAPLVIAADTVVVADGEALGKPRDAAENRTFLRRLSGRSHAVVTGHCLLRGDRTERAAPRTTVTMRSLHDDEIARYVATGEGSDKAGGYAVQARGAAFVTSIEGCWTNVVGLSVPTVVVAARRLGVALV